MAELRPRLVYGDDVWWPRCKLKGAKKALDKVQRMVLGGIIGCMRSTPGFLVKSSLVSPPLDLWIRKMAFMATCRLQSHSSKGGLMDWELVEQLGLQAPVVQDRGPKKKWFFEKSFTVTIGERSE